MLYLISCALANHTITRWIKAIRKLDLANADIKDITCIRECCLAMLRSVESHTYKQNRLADWFYICIHRKLKDLLEELSANLKTKSKTAE